MYKLTYDEISYITIRLRTTLTNTTRTLTKTALTCILTAFTTLDAHNVYQHLHVTTILTYIGTAFITTLTCTTTGILRSIVNRCYVVCGNILFRTEA